MSDTELAILIVLIAYKVILLGIGFFAQRRTHDDADLYLGGRRLGPLVAAVSAAASSSSAWTLLGVSGAAYSYGLSAIWLFPACVGGFALNWFVVAPRLRRHSARTGALTLAEVLADGSRSVRVLAAMITLACLLTYVAAQFNGAGKSFESTFSAMTDPTIAVLVGGAIVIAYTMLGGFWAVSLTDTLQGLVMAATAVILPAAALVQVGGFTELGAELSKQPADFLSLTRGLGPILGIGFVLGYLGIGLGYPGQPHVVTRFMALRDDDSVRRARNYSMIWAVLVYAGMILLGLCGRALLTEVPQGDGERLFIELAQDLFPPLVTGVMLAAVLSAMMSTADSQLLVAASSVSHDLGATKGGSRLLGDRVVILLLSLGAMAAALYTSPQIFNKVLFAWTAMGAAFGPVLLHILFLGRLRPSATLAAMLLGFGSSVLSHNWPITDLHGFDRRFAPFLLSTAAMFALNKKR